MNSSHKMEQDSILLMLVSDLMVPASKVAYVTTENTLEHALLILTGSGYSAIPVLDKSSSVKGVINTTLIMKSIMTVDGYDIDKLGQYHVEAVMAKEVARLREDDDFRRALDLSIHRPFICVEDNHGKFAGILTRQAILATMQRYLRRL